MCHGPAALVNARTPAGSHLVSGKNVTGFSSTEENRVGLTDVVPFLLEDRLRERGARYSKAEDFTAYVVVDELLITGQNPASSAPTAIALLGLLTGNHAR
jgi:putative intracellular protease/amidase